MFGFFRRAASPEVALTTCSKRLHEAILEKVKVGNAARVEDLINTAASILGECCIAYNGEIDPRQHPLQPGDPILSDAMNRLLSGDVAGSEFAAVPRASIFGLIRDGICNSGYEAGDFPSLEAVYRNFVANAHGKQEWGWVPLSVPEQHVPFVRPLQVAYEMRPVVHRACRECGTMKLRLLSCVYALISILAMVKDAIDRKVALLLAVETINGVAKTAPLTDEMMRTLRQQFAGQSKTQA